MRAEKRELTGSYSHSIIYGTHNQLTGNNFLKSYFQRTVLYTVTGKLCPVSSGSRTGVHRPFRLRLPGQRILPGHDFFREIG